MNIIGFDFMPKDNHSLRAWKAEEMSPPTPLALTPPRFQDLTPSCLH